MSLPPRIPPAYAAALYEPFAPNYYNTPYSQGLCRAFRGIQCVGFADLLDTDYFNFETAAGEAGTFEFDVADDGASGVRIAIAPGGGWAGTETPAQVAAIVQAVIEAQSWHVVVSQAGDGLLYIRDTIAGEVYHITEHVNHVDFEVFNYNLGSDGDGFVPVRWGLSRAFVPDGRIFS